MVGHGLCNVEKIFNTLTPFTFLDTQHYHVGWCIRFGESLQGQLSWDWSTAYLGQGVKHLKLEKQKDNKNVFFMTTTNT